eukprot:196882_1
MLSNTILFIVLQLNSMLYPVCLNHPEVSGKSLKSTTSYSPRREKCCGRERTKGLSCYWITFLVIYAVSLAMDPIPLASLVTRALPYILVCVLFPDPNISLESRLCVLALCQSAAQQTMEGIISLLLPKVKTMNDVTARLHSAALLFDIFRSDSLVLPIVPYLVFVVVPVVAMMSDTDKAVRKLAAKSFALSIRLIPLESGIPDPPNMDRSLVESRQRERAFLQQLVDGSKIRPFVVPVPINATLRHYQQEGINWLWFLRQFNLHGILCDDMGLGKTLQTLCVIAGDHHTRRSASGKAGLSLVIAPSTVVPHWAHEIDQFCRAEDLSSLQYVGSPEKRKKLRSKIEKLDGSVVIASYETMRSDISFLSKIRWNYCVLDEGHIIKNAKSKTAEAAKSIQAYQRLILSGTPIQNNVLEMWSLFDFLMPGYLGEMSWFNQTFSKPIKLSYTARSSKDAQEKGALALEKLHKQVLPFLLRRLKSDVLKDLPPKIIQDHYVEMSPLQMRLYQAFSNSGSFQKAISDIQTDSDRPLKRPVSNEASASSQHKSKPARHVFQALQYMRKLVSHPKLVLTPDHPSYKVEMQRMKREKLSLSDISCAPKIDALRELLEECGIGTSTQPTSTSSTSSKQSEVISVEDTLTGGTGMPTCTHRVLVFAQLKSVLDIVEKDLFVALMPTVHYRRLDGGVDHSKRFEIVTEFNNDPTIEVLLLTTRVGGLGLNLTGADTVIFLEHDWNPAADLQAMDRAHRIGQKKVVNVYRLITRGTLEEKIMGIQAFKRRIADSVITEDNASLRSMDTGQVLDLLKVSSERVGQNEEKADISEEKQVDSFGSVNVQPSRKRPRSGLNSVVDNLEDLWSESQYEEEYNLDNFVKSL